MCVSVCVCAYLRWEKFTASVEKLRTPEAVNTLFPFHEFFGDAPQPIFKGASYEQVCA